VKVLSFKLETEKESSKHYSAWFYAEKIRTSRGNNSGFMHLKMQVSGCIATKCD